MTDAIATAWQYTLGQLPYQVTAYERLAKGGVVYLRWRASTKKGRNWKHKSLGFAVRDGGGRLIREAEKRAQDETAKQLALLITGLPREEIATRLTLRQGRNLAFEPQTGKYPTNTAHRRETDRALLFAIAVLGEDRTWDTIRKADLRRLWRARIEQITGKGKAGLRGAEVVIARLLTVAEWLRSEELIPSTACVAPRHWKQELSGDWREITEARTDYEPARPRHTAAELRQILAVAPRVDPRFALLLALGAELRLGQVVRGRRVDLDLVAGTFTVRRRGKKRGTVVKLTRGQLAAARAAIGAGGYLEPLETRALPEGSDRDYPLFPQGQLTGGRKGEPHAVDRHRTAAPVNRRTLQQWFKEAEQLAGIAHVKGRGAYGLRRAAVDGAKELGISREGLKEHGGWVDSQMPDQVYADQEADYARDEARDVRAKIRGEAAE
jgi:integrase